MALEQQKKRLWILSELYYPELTSTGYYLTSIAEALAGDLDVRVICGQPNYSARTRKAPRHESRKGVEIHRVLSFRLNKNILLFRVINIVSLSAMIFAKAVAAFRPGDRVLVVTNPPVLPAVVALASLIRGAQYTVLIHDLYPEQLAVLGLLTPKSVVVKAIDFVNQWSYKHAAQIVTVGRDMQRLLKRKVEGLAIPVEFIPNWAETDTLRPYPRDENLLLRELGLQHKFVVLYAGNLGRPNAIETVVEAATELVGEENIHFLFIGEGVRKKWLRESVRHNALTNVTILDAMPRSQQDEFLNACDVTIVPIVSGMAGAAVPSRIYNYMAVGKPVIGVCDEDCEIAAIIDEENIGVHVPANDGKALAVAVHSLSTDGGNIEEMGERARKAAVEKYSPAKILPRYKALLSK